VKKPPSRQLGLSFEEPQPEVHPVSAEAPPSNLVGPDRLPRYTTSEEDAEVFLLSMPKGNRRLWELAMREINGWASGFYEEAK